MNSNFKLKIYKKKYITIDMYVQNLLIIYNCFLLL